MKKINYTKTIGLALIIGFVAMGTCGFSQSSNYLDFDGTNDYVRYNNDATLQLMDGATNYTMEAWIYPIDGLVAEYDRVFQRFYSFNIQMWDGDNNGLVEDWYFVAINSSGGNVYFNTEGDATLTLDAWNHIAVINNSVAGTLKLYVNGVDVTQAGGYSNYSLRSAQSSDNLYIGSFGTTQSFFGGYIDEIRLKNIAEDIGSLQAHITDYEYTTDANTAALFHFNEGTGTTTVNAASSSDATLNNGAIWRTWDYVSGHSLPLDNRYIWNGTTDADWATTSNWDPDAIPNSTDNVLIRDVTNDPQVEAGISTDCNDLEIESGSILSVRGNLTVNGTLTNNAGTSGLIVEADASGNGSLIESDGVSATVQQHISADVWHLISSPVSGAVSGVYTGLYLFEWVEADADFTNIISTDYPLAVTHGYYTWSENSIPSPTNIEFTGNLNTGDYPISWMTYTAQGYTDGDGWNLVGNPYPSGLKWDNTWSQSNLDPTVYVDDAAGSGNWLIYNYSSGTGNTLPNGEIPPTQGFYVKANAASPSMTIPGSARVHTSNVFYKGGNKAEDVIKINLTSNSNSYSDCLFLGLNNEASNYFDSQYDAYKLFGIEEAPQLYAYDEDVKYAVNLFPEFSDTKTIAFGIKVGFATEYIFNVEGLDNFNPDIEVYLEDIVSGAMINLRDNPVYTFYAEPGQDESRFILHFNPEFVQINSQQQGDEISVYSFENKVIVNYPFQTIGKTAVYNINGSLIAEQKLHMGLNEINLLAENGYYVVKVISSSNIKTQKVFIK